MSTVVRVSLASLVLVLLAPLAHASAASGYSGAAAASYADQYWSTYNPQWPSFANKGGDCTNFTSQALYTGGIAMRPAPQYSGDAAWYMVQQNRKQWSYSTPWVNAQHDSAFLEQTLPGVTVVGTYTGLAPGQIVASKAAQGDIILYDWTNDGTFDHEAIVTASDGMNPDGTTNWDLVDAHTNNRYHAYWTLTQYNTQWSTTRIVVLHIPSTAS